VIDDARRAIDYATDRGVVVIAAAGNEFFPLCDEPAFSADAICVIATTVEETKATYSNFNLNGGPFNVVSGPGGAAFLSCEENIISTIPSGAGGFCTENVGTPGYDFYAGTSMALRASPESPRCSRPRVVVEPMANGCSSRRRVLLRSTRAARIPRPTASASWTPRPRLQHPVSRRPQLPIQH